MLREIFYGLRTRNLPMHEELGNAEPREVFIIACLLVPIIGFGLYPKLLTQIYDSTTETLTAQLKNQVFVVGEGANDASVPIAALPVLKAPSVSQ